MADPVPNPIPMQSPEPTPVTPRGIQRLFRDEKAMAAIIATVSVLGTYFGMAQPERIKHFSEIMLSIIGVWGAVIGGWSYSDGKAMEGTVPVGRETTPLAPTVPAGPAVVVQAPAATVATVMTDSMTAAAAHMLAQNQNLSPDVIRELQELASGPKKVSGS